MGGRVQLHQGFSLLLQLPDGIITRIAGFLPPREAAYNLRVACKAFALEVRSEELLSVPIGKKRPPVPAHALLGRWGQLGSCRGLTYKQRVQLLVDAARGGDIKALQQLSHSTGCFLNEEVFRTAACAGQEAMCEWLLEQEVPLKDDGAWVLAAAVEAGQMQLCEKLYTAGFRLLYYTTLLAARTGYGDASAWPYGQGTLYHADEEDIARAGMPEDLPDEWWANAAQGGRVELMWQLKGFTEATPKDLPAVAYGCPVYDLQDMVRECKEATSFPTQSEAAAILSAAVCSPTPDWHDKVLWLLRRRLFSPLATLSAHPAGDFAALPDAVQRLEWLAGQGFGLVGCKELLQAAVRAGKAELVRKMSLQAEAVAGDTPGDLVARLLIPAAVQKGHLDLAKELHGRGLPVDALNLALATGRTGQVGAVQWALGVMREEAAKRNAAAASTGEDGGGGALGVGPGARTAASESDQLLRTDVDTVRGTYGNAITAMMDGACASGSLELVRWLHARGVGWGAYQLGCAAASGNEVLVQWMVEQGYEVLDVSWEGTCQGRMGIGAGPHGLGLCGAVMLLRGYGIVPKVEHCQAQKLCLPALPVSCRHIASCPLQPWCHPPSNALLRRNGCWTTPSTPTCGPPSTVMWP